MLAPKPSLDEWWAATMGLLPQGLAWARDRLSNLGRLIEVMADERRQRHERSLILLEAEAVPTLSVELLPEWERALGLPDPCRAAPGTLAERHAEVADIFFADHAPTAENMVAWAARAGWNISIREQRDFVLGVSQLGDAMGESDFAWVVSVLDQNIDFFRLGQNALGDPFWTWPDLATLECVLRRANPGHLQIYFIVP